eukprot:TRINITY_DN34052_c0_g1_i1.p1 TRINITY_DN34052_c0_g1~~TRINITY_DN34052_c0_g1_i1.p1  ORF type:complete len:1293 (-),score=179.43 TRINITY_DN34052_c0_g1_i1:7-3885(-)
MGNSSCGVSRTDGFSPSCCRGKGAVSELTNVKGQGPLCRKSFGSCSSTCSCEDFPNKTSRIHGYSTAGRYNTAGAEAESEVKNIVNGQIVGSPKKQGADTTMVDNWNLDFSVDDWHEICEKRRLQTSFSETGQDGEDEEISSLTFEVASAATAAAEAVTAQAPRETAMMGKVRCAANGVRWRWSKTDSVDSSSPFVKSVQNVRKIGSTPQNESASRLEKRHHAESLLIGDTMPVAAAPWSRSSPVSPPFPVLAQKPRKLSSCGSTISSVWSSSILVSRDDLENGPSWPSDRRLSADSIDAVSTESTWIPNDSTSVGGSERSSPVRLRDSTRSVGDGPLTPWSENVISPSSSADLVLSVDSVAASGFGLKTSGVKGNNSQQDAQSAHVIDHHRITRPLSVPCQRSSVISCNSTKTSNCSSHLTRSGDDDSSHSGEMEDLRAPAIFLRPRKGGISAGSLDKRVLTLPTIDKNEETRDKLREALTKSFLFQHLRPDELEAVVAPINVVHVRHGENLVRQGCMGDTMYVVLDGTVSCYLEDPEEVRCKPSFHDDPNCSGVMNPTTRFWVANRNAGTIVGELAILCNTPRSLSVYASGNCTLGRVDRMVYQNLVVHAQIRRREHIEECLRKVKILEMLNDEQIAQLGDVMETRIYEPGQAIIRQGDVGTEFFIVRSGECIAEVTTYDETQEVRRYFAGDLFGELALLKNAKRAASVLAVGAVEALVLSRGPFERMLGPLSLLQERQYINDPRKLVADFYRKGDSRGPAGSLELAQSESAAKLESESSSWFAVFRPTSRDAIAKLLGGIAVGKGLNVKGKSAKKNRLSGFVPFVQICDNNHKELVEQFPDGSRVDIFYKTKAARDEALKQLSAIVRDTRDRDESGNPISTCSPTSPTKSEGSMMSFFTNSRSNISMCLTDSCIYINNSYEPQVFGLNVPGPVVHAAYIMLPDLSPLVDWETGRLSEPAFMSMNIHAVVNGSEPRIVLYQYDEGDPMNPRGLLVAYAERTVKPVVSDFDAFLVASRGVTYEPLPEEQLELVSWSLDIAEEIMSSPVDGVSWTSRWLECLKREALHGFSPDIPKYGFGDPKSYKLMADVIVATEPCGAVRHGAECFNFCFPQELDNEYLVVWEGFPDKPWDYKSEAALRSFLVDRIREGFTFPLNPVWPIRDAGWYDVLTEIRAHKAAQEAWDGWYPQKIAKRIDAIHEAHKGGFANQLSTSSVRRSTSGLRSRLRFSKGTSLSGSEQLDLLGQELGDRRNVGVYGKVSKLLRKITSPKGAFASKLPKRKRCYSVGHSNP